MDSACRFPALALVSLLSATLLPACDDDAYAGTGAGFLFVVGGGASTTPDQKTLKPSQVDLHKRAWDAFQAARKAGARIGESACSVEYHADGADTQAALDTSKRLFQAAGAPEAALRGFVFDVREKASDPRLVEDLAAGCGLVYLPGGDQTEMRGLWDGTPLQKALRGLVARGGGVMGKSAGAALQGTIGYFPGIDSETTAGALLKDARVGPKELGEGFLAKASLADAGAVPFPRFYVETHAGDRERTARALAVLAAWERSRPAREPAGAPALVVDSDTGALLRYDTSVNGWVADVHGGRAVEFLFPTASSDVDVSPGGKPTYTNVVTTLALEGARVVISGPVRGRVLRFSQVLPGGAPKPVAAGGASGAKESAADRGETGPRESASRESACARALASEILGRYDSDGERNSEVRYDAFDPVSGTVKHSGDVEYAYLTGDFRAVARPGGDDRGCGYWLTNSFDVDYGRPENRLNAMRYALGAGHAGFAVALPVGMRARVPLEGQVSFLRDREGDEGSSVFLYDARKALRRGVSGYVYTELGARGPVQTGSWENALTHLLAPGGRFDLDSGTATR